MLERIKIKLDKNYITEALETESLSKLVASNSPSVVHRIYLIKNGLKKRQHFLELTNSDRYIVWATLTTNFAYAGEARRQAEVISFMRNMLKQKPSYVINFTITDKTTMKELFKFKHQTASKREVVELINKLEEKTKRLCEPNTY